MSRHNANYEGIGRHENVTDTWDILFEEQKTFWGKEKMSVTHINSMLQKLPKENTFFIWYKNWNVCLRMYNTNP